jgi:hypothetical protein
MRDRLTLVAVYKMGLAGRVQFAEHPRRPATRPQPAPAKSAQKVKQSQIPQVFDF